MAKEDSLFFSRPDDKIPHLCLELEALLVSQPGIFFNVMELAEYFGVNTNTIKYVILELRTGENQSLFEYLGNGPGNKGRIRYCGNGLQPTTAGLTAEVEVVEDWSDELGRQARAEFYERANMSNTARQARRGRQRVIKRF